MFTLNVAFGPIAWVLAFHKKETAEDAIKNLMALPTSGMIVAGIRENTPCINVVDDFGQSIACHHAPTAILFEELEKSKLLQVDYRMHQARIQQEFQSRAEADASMRARRGPAILQPMPMAPRANGGL